MRHEREPDFGKIGHCPALGVHAGLDLVAELPALGRERSFVTAGDGLVIDNDRASVDHGHAVGSDLALDSGLFVGPEDGRFDDPVQILVRVMSVTAFVLADGLGHHPDRVQIILANDRLAIVLDAELFPLFLAGLGALVDIGRDRVLVEEVSGLEDVLVSRCAKGLGRSGFVRLFGVVLGPKKVQAGFP